MDADEFYEAVVELCLSFGGSVTSWTRSEKHNRAVGGVARSKHLYGKAVDIVCDSEEGKKQLKAAAVEFDLFVLDEGDHIHIGMKN